MDIAAAGTTGREILFQATSEQMIEAYSHVPRFDTSRKIKCFLRLRSFQALRYHLR